MAKLKVLKQKEKRYAFRVFENESQKNPAICVFKRFPQPGETFFSGLTESFTDKLDIDVDALKENKKETVKKISDQIVSTLINNIAASNIDFIEFATECISHFEDFTVEETGQSIHLVKEFLSLPEEAVNMILQDCYEYALEKDEFTMGE